MKRIALVAFALVLAGCGGGEDAGDLLLPGRTIAATADIWPRTSLFGDSLTARLVVSVDRRRIDPDDLQLRARFAPYEQVEDFDIERRDVGHQTQLVYTTQLRCDEFLCLPRDQRLPIALPPVRIGSLIVRWPRIEVASRINQSELQVLRYRATVAPVPDATARVAPRSLAAASFSAAALLALLALGLFARAALRTWRRRPELDLPPVERALVLLRWTRDGEDRRRALELLASALDDEGRRDLARAARRLAWSDASPTAQQAEELATQVREGRRAA